MPKPRTIDEYLASVSAEQRAVEGAHRRDAAQEPGARRSARSAAARDQQETTLIGFP